MAPPGTLVSADELHRLISAIFVGAGVEARHAEMASEVFVWANLRGIDSHGVTRVPRYVELFASGEANPTPDIRMEHPRPGVIVMSADRAPGPVALTLAMDEAIACARQTGVAWAAVRQTVHTGAIGYYVDRAAKAGMVGIGLVSGMPNMGYAGVKGSAVATSPIAIAAPSKRHGVVLLDMATATIALGRIAQYRQKGQPLPEGAALDADGQPTTDPALAVTPTPMAGAKGSGLSLMIELVTGALAGASIFAPFHQKAPGARKHRQNAALIAVDIAAFGGLETFQSAVDEALDQLKALPRENETQPVLFPGERGANTERERRADGIPLGAKIWTELQALTANLKITTT